MNQEIKQRWLKALRSGEYKQGKYRLKSNDSFCCLGVLCDVVKEDLKQDWDEYDNFMKLDDVLPDEVITYAELPNGNPNIFDEEAEIISSLAELNDNLLNFEEIANLIEKHL